VPIAGSLPNGNNDINISLYQGEKRPARVPRPARHRVLLRVIGSPDPYGKQIDGMGGATSSTSKTVIVSKSTRPDHDVDYLFGQVSIDKPFVDWSGNCGNLSAAVGPFAISNGLVDASRVPRDGRAVVRLSDPKTGCVNLVTARELRVARR